jgi:tetratricopeptide (TPR) repeat protein
MPKAKILADSREALTIKAGLKEIIFATTCPSDTGMTDAAHEVESELRAEGQDLRVVVLSWSDLELKISQHPAALAFFNPAAVASSSAQSPVKLDNDTINALADAFARRQPSFQPVIPADVVSPSDNSEDPALHGKIDLLRDLFRNMTLSSAARDGLIKLKSTEDLSAKPWARFRIETNLGSIALSLGNHEEAAGLFEKAYEIRPTDANAVANLAVARTIQGRPEEAMALARSALAATPRSDQAVSFLLQAAARSSWHGDPESLIPTDLVGSVHADLGLVEFLRKREIPGWAEKTREIAAKHPDLPEFKRVFALAILELAIGGDAFFGRPGIIAREDLERATNDMLEVAKSCLDTGYADLYDLFAYVSNAASLLRLSGRPAACEALLLRALPVLPDRPSLKQMLALSQLAQDKFEDAETTLRHETDPESRLLAAEMAARRDPKEAIGIIEAIDAGENQRLLELKWRILGDIALRARDFTRVESAIAGLAAVPSGTILADILRLRLDARRGVDEEDRWARLREMAKREATLESNLFRYLVAEEMREQGLWDEAARLIEPIADLQHLSPATRLYLGCLADARRDEALRNALSSASSAVLNDPETLWLVATHSWNIGDLPESRRALDKLLAIQPDDGSARLLQVELLLRSDDLDNLLPELDRPIEQLRFHRLTDRFRVAALLGNFGHMDRAVAYAYRLFQENKGMSQAWMCFSGLVLRESTDIKAAEEDWKLSAVADNAAVDMEYEDGEKSFIIIEPNAAIRRLDADSWEPDHQLSRAIMGLKVGDRFTNPSNSKSGTVKEIRHKYVAKYHFVLAHHESRFPTIGAIRSMSIDVSTPEGIAPILDELKARRDWVEQEQSSYLNGISPLTVLGHRIGSDVIDVASGIAGQGLRLKVTRGDELERQSAVTAIASNGSSRCVMDVLAFWTCWKLEALGAVSDVCGPIHLPQSTMDQLYGRREQINQHSQSGLKSAAYRDGGLAMTEVAPDVIQVWLKDLDSAIDWAKQHAIICPLIASEKLPDELRQFLRSPARGIFDALMIAFDKDCLLITDDLPTREIGQFFGFGRSSWLQPVFLVAFNRRKIDFETYTKWMSHLIGAGHGYIGVSTGNLMMAAKIDHDAGQCPGYFFKEIGKMIGGTVAEPNSHINVALEFLRYVWTTDATRPYRAGASGHLLEQLIRERTGDYGRILRTVAVRLKDISEFIEYMSVWLTGHFLRIDR